MIDCQENSGKIVVWDFNGTLLDDVDLCVSILCDMLGHRGLPIVDRMRYLEVFGFPIIDYYRMVGFDFARWPYEELALEFMDAYLPASLDMSLRPGVMEALAAFASAGVRQVMLSASNLEYLRLQAAHFGIDGYFEEMLGLSDIYGTGKAGIGQTWALRMRGSVPGPVKTPRIVLIGDTGHDCEVARAMGAGCVLACGGHNSLARLRDAGADAVADSISDAAAAVRKLLDI